MAGFDPESAEFFEQTSELFRVLLAREAAPEKRPDNAGSPTECNRQKIQLPILRNTRFDDGDGAAFSAADQLSGYQRRL